jgi:predicted nuclease with TOPRIM domain
MNKSLKDIQNQLQNNPKENKALAKENTSLLTELNKFKEIQAQQ